MRAEKLKINYYVLMLFFLLGCSEGHADIEEYQSAYESKINDCDKLESLPDLQFLKNLELGEKNLGIIIDYQYFRQWHDCVQPERGNYKKVLEDNIHHFPAESEYRSHLRIVLSDYKALAEVQAEYDQLPAELRNSIESNKVFSTPFNIIEVSEVLLPQPTAEE